MVLADLPRLALPVGCMRLAAAAAVMKAVVAPPAAGTLFPGSKASRT
jgi:hypothetical protein